MSAHQALLPPIPPSIRVFSSESTLRTRWPKYWSFSFSISPSSEYPGLIPFRMDWLDLLTVQRTLKKCLAIAKSLQSCPTLCDLIDGSPPGSPVPGIPQARTLEWVAISFSNAWKWKVKVKSLSQTYLIKWGGGFNRWTIRNGTDTRLRENLSRIWP